MADEHGEPIADVGVVHAVVTLERSEGLAWMTTVSTFESTRQLENMAATGMEEGMRQAMGQIDSLLAEQALRPQARYRPAGCVAMVRSTGGRLDAATRPREGGGYDRSTA